MVSLFDTRSTPRRILSDASGVSLIEALIAAALLGLALIPVAYVQSGGTRAAVGSYEISAASALAVDLCDKVHSISYSDTRLASTSGNYVAPDATLSNTNPLAPDGTTWSACSPNKCGYTRKWKVSDNTPLTNTKRVDVQVSWSEYGVTRTFTLSTIKAIGS